MVDLSKTKRELIEEVESLRQRVAELEQTESSRPSTEDNSDLLRVLRDSEKKYRTLFEDSNDAIFIEDSDGVVDVNQAALELLGYTKDDLLDPDVHHDIFVDSGHEERMRQQLFDKGYVKDYEARLKRKDGSFLDCLFTASVQKVEDGRGWKLQCIVHDISERVQAEDQARKLAHENAVMAEISRIISSSLDIEQVYERFAQEAKRILPFDRISVGLVNLEEGTFTDAYYSGLKVEGRDFGTVNQLANSVTEQIVNSNRGIIVELFDEDELAKQYYLMKDGYQAGIRSSVSVPLVSHGDVIGVMHFQSSTSHAYDEHDLELADRVAFYVADAIANWQLYSELRHAQEELRHSEERLRVLVEAVPVPVVLTRLEDGQIHYANEHMATLFGLNLDEMIGNKTPNLYYDPSDRESVIAQMRSQGYLRNVEVRAKKADGEPFWVSVSAEPTLVDGQDALLTAFTDVTERRQAEEHFQVLAQSSPVGIFLIEDGRFTFVNDKFLEETGFTESEIIGQDSMALVVPEDRDLVQENVRSMLRGESSQPYEFRGLTKDGDIQWLMGTVDSIEYEGKQAVVGSYMNVSERKRAELLFSGLAQSSPLGIFVTEEGSFIFVNAYALQESGFSEEEIIGQVAINYVVPDDKERLGAYLDRVRSGEHLEPIEYRIYRKDGSIWWVLGSFAPVTYSGRLAMVGTYMDINERKRAEELFQTLAHSLPIGVFLIDNGKFTFVNEQFCKDNGKTPEELLGLRADQLIHPDDRELVTEKAVGMAIGESSEAFEYRALSQGDEEQWILGSFAQISYEGRSALLGSYMEITDRKRAEQRIRETLEEKETLLEEIQHLYTQEQRRAEQFTLIDEVGRKITSILDVDELLKEVAQSIQESFGYHHVGIGLTEGDRVVYKFGAGATYEGLLPNQDSRSFKIGVEGLTGRVAASGEPIMASNVRSNPDYVSVAHPETQSELTVPIRVKGQIIGVLDVQSEQANAFDTTDLTVLQSLADQTGIAIENARLFETGQLHLEHMKVINDVAIEVSSIFSLGELLPFVTNLFYQAFDPYSVSIALIDEISNEIAILASAGNYEGEPPIGKVFELESDEQGICVTVANTGRYIVANDVSKEPLFHHMEEMAETKSELAVPISIGDQVIGVLDVESDRLNAFSDIYVSTALNIANQLAIAIENSRLLDETRDVAVLAERNRMAREIHDTMAQGFTGIVLQLEAAEQAYDETPVELPEHLDKAKTLARECLQEARRSVWNLLPKVLEEKPLAGALEGEIASFVSAGDVKADFKVSGARRELPADIQAAVLRICQESLTNIRKHAKASHVDVNLDFQDTEVCLTVKDDGVGIGSKEETDDVRQGGFGLKGMEQRVRLLRGTLTISSSKDDGTSIQAIIPTQ